jgi:hypothetical protein
MDTSEAEVYDEAQSFDPFERTNEHKRANPRGLRNVGPQTLAAFGPVARRQKEGQSLK